MKAKPVKINQDGTGYIECDKSECTHIQLNIPGPTSQFTHGKLTLPIITSGSRRDTNCWTWNGSTDSPTLMPSVLSEIPGLFRCHTWITDGKAQFLDDCDHDLRGQTIELLEVN